MAGRGTTRQRSIWNLAYGRRSALSDSVKRSANEAWERYHLMGFDTNFPLGHEDFPPHIHIILRWPHFTGSQAPHFYLSNKGLLEGDVAVTIDGLPQIAKTSFPQSTPVPAVDYWVKRSTETVENAEWRVADAAKTRCWRMYASPAENGRHKALRAG